MLEGQSIVPLQPVQVIEVDYNQFLVPGGIAGPPCLGYYEYGRLAHHTGGWAVGQQPVTIGKLLGNLKCGLRMGELQ
jgi:hypothetical protein